MAAELLNLQLPQDVFRFAFCLFTRYPRKMKGDHDVILYGKIVNKTVVLQDNPHVLLRKAAKHPSLILERCTSSTCTSPEVKPSIPHRTCSNVDFPAPGFSHNRHHFSVLNSKADVLQREALIGLALVIIFCQMLYPYHADSSVQRSLSRRICMGERALRATKAGINAKATTRRSMATVASIL